MTLASWVMLIAGVLFGGVSVPLVGKPLWAKLFSGAANAAPALVPLADTSLQYFTLVVQLMHKLLDQAAPIPPPPPPPPVIPVSPLLSEMERLLLLLKASQQTPPPPPVPAPLTI